MRRVRITDHFRDGTIRISWLRSDWATEGQTESTASMTLHTFPKRWLEDLRGGRVEDDLAGFQKLSEDMAELFALLGFETEHMSLT